MPASVYVPSHLENRTQLVQLSKPPPKDDDSSLRTVDALIRRRALLHPHDHAVSYPSSGTTFQDYTLRQLDVFAWRVAKHYETQLPVRKSSAEKPAVVALLGPSNLEYLITMLALSKLGHTVLLVSTRIPQVAIESLLNVTGASALVVDEKFLETATKVQENVAVEILPIAARDVFEFPIDAHGDTRLDGLDPEVETNHVAFIIHSSGKSLPSVSLR